MRVFVPSILVALLASPALAKPVYEGQAPVAYLEDVASGAILYDRDSRRKIPTASMAKMMTAYVVFEKIKAGKLKLDQKFVVKPETGEKWGSVGSTMYLKSGEKVPLEALVDGLITLSGNDAAVVIAEGVSGTVPAFLKEMNAAAKKLGMKDSHFATPNGWPDGGKTYSTARDLSLLSRAIISGHPAYFRRFFSKRSFTWDGVTQTNRNPLLGVIDGADGLKTGHSDEAGYCLTGTASRNGRRLLMVIAGLPTMQGRVDEARAFLNWGYDAWAIKPLFAAKTRITRIPVQLGSELSVPAVALGNVGALYPKGEKPSFKLSTRYNGPLKAPVRSGQPVGELIVKHRDGRIQTVPLVAQAAVERTGYFGRAWNGLRLLVGAS
ncbi:MAG: D-alanyl-D-alanine carboxypeptidase [Sphingomonadales bacterium]|nr:D-alanyl-D-alanine carboxypeptidase [Sphingomonadales bacterium]